MKNILYKSTNNPEPRVNFETALLRGMAPDYGLYMIAREDIPTLGPETIRAMRNMSYAQIAFQVLYPYLGAEVPEKDLSGLLEDAYREDKIPTDIQQVTDDTYIMWLTRGPTYSFKDYAARFFGRMLNYFLEKHGLRRVVVVATSGDTGGAVADALWGLGNVDNIVFFPKGSISEGQRRQMTTLGRNVYAFEVNGDFDVCQALAKNLLGDKGFAGEVFGDAGCLTSANSISIGRLLPQAVYPFFAYSRIITDGGSLVASIPSGNFGDMMGTVLAKGMGLPISKILCGVNENREFTDFLYSGIYNITASKTSPSSAMIVSHPSNLARLIDFYAGHMFDERDQATGNVLKAGVIAGMPDMAEMRKDLYSVSIDNPQHYRTMKEVYEKYRVILDPHGAVGWRTLELYRAEGGEHHGPAVIYETADPGKFPFDVQQAIGLTPDLPPGMKKQASLPERIYTIAEEPDRTTGAKILSAAQIREAKEKIRKIFAG
ncbi:MAG: Threonine synthase [Syntrophorhabdaceae bacterium PtaU1.Bin034]|nr:MAG: Threonine synthase [Syntrophorhabdaceae bacterium PtaU1.Bin034]